MKNVLWLMGILLCAGGAYADELRADQIADGKKRNEAAYEQRLEQSGWKNETTPQTEKTNSQPTRQGTNDSSQSKSS